MGGTEGRTVKNFGEKGIFFIAVTEVHIAQAKNCRGKFFGEKIFRRECFFRVSHSNPGCFFRGISGKKQNEAGNFLELESFIFKANVAPFA